MINFNGSLFSDSDRMLSSQNRAFRYGDGLFESMRVVNGKIPFYNHHFDRLTRGMKALRIKTPTYFNPHYLKNEISKVVENQKFCRLRLAVWREEGGLYTPTSNDPDFLIETAPLVDKNFSLNDLGMTIGIFKDFTLRETPISAYKTSNALPYILAAMFAKENSFDEVLMLNQDGNVAEGFGSNLFLVKNKTLITPSVSSGCVGGVMRQIVIEMAQKAKIEVKEMNTPLSIVRDADEIFYTNAVQGIKWVENFEVNTYTNDTAQFLMERLLESIK